MSVQLARGAKADTLHIRNDVSGDALCGESITAATTTTRRDLFCGACWRTVNADDDILSIEALLADKLATLPYDIYLRTAHWKRTRQLALDHYGSTCVLCGAEPVEVHHRTYERRGCELLSDLIVLCGACHAQHHGQAA
jgi:hypothetical protein